MSNKQIKETNAAAENRNEQNTELQAEEGQSVKELKKVRRSEKAVKRYQWIILRILIAIFIVWLLFFQVIGLTHMPNEDMYPRIDSGDLVLFYRLDKDVHSQDIIVIQKTTPESPDKKEVFICRVVAKGGDTVEITDDKRLVVNGNTVMENNIFYPTTKYEGYTEYPITLAEDECFVLADARENGTDSRYFGPVSKSEIVGTVITIFRRNNL